MLRFPLHSSGNFEPAFSAIDALGGVGTDPLATDGAGLIRINVECQPELIRFYGARHDADPDSAIIFFEGDVLQHPESSPDRFQIHPGYTQITPRSMQEAAETWASSLKRNFVNLARPGSYGSTGDHRQRRRPREVAVVDAALSRLKEVFEWNSFDLAGLSGGGHLVAALLARRTDIRYAVIASGNVAVRQRLGERGLTIDITGYSDFYDPIEHVQDVAQHPPTKLIMLTDRKDTVVSCSAQSAYVQALREVGVSVDQRTADGIDPRHHVISMSVILQALAQ